MARLCDYRLDIAQISDYPARMTHDNTPMIKAPPHCETMTEVREGVDEVDRQLVELLALRFGYMDAAARIKANKSDVRDEKRKAQVIDNAASLAEKYGLPRAIIAKLWDDLVEASIAHEDKKWDDLRG